MPIGIGAGLLIGGAISGGATVAGSALAASAAKDAAKTQAASADKAAEIQKQMYEQQRSDLTPYRSAGQGAMGLLGYGLGIPGFEQGPTSQAPKEPAVQPFTPTFDPAHGFLAGMRNAAAMRNAGPGAIPSTPDVLLRAPDGTTKVVPSTDAEHYVSKGARIIGGA